MTRAGITHTTLFEGGVDRYPFFRIPAVVRAGDGVLLAFAQGRSVRGDLSDADIVLKRSFDHGLTWTPLQVVAENGDNVARNPTPIFDDRSGDVILLYCTSDSPEKEIIEGSGDVGVWYVRSSDNGDSWSAPVDITAEVRPDDWRHYALNPGHGIQLSDGRLLAGGNHSRAGVDGFWAHSLYSDDGGVSWKLGGVVNFKDANENQVVEQSDGVVLMNFRIQDYATFRRGVVTSSDGGASWNDNAKIVEQLVDPACQGSIINYQGRIILCNPASTTDRENLTLTDGGAQGSAWRELITIQEGFAAYSDLVIQGNDNLGVLWEAMDYKGIKYSIVTPDLLEVGD